MLSSLGLLLDILGFVILFYNGNFTRNFNRLDGFSIYENNERGQGGGIRAIEKKDKVPRVLDYLGFGLIVAGFVFQLFGSVSSLCKDLGWSCG